MGVIRDRLREKYKNNGNRIDARWTLDDVVSADEISGSFLSASAYELSFPADQPDTARIECAKAFPLRNGPLVLITNLRTGQDAWQEPPIDEGQDLFKGLAIVLAILLWCGIPMALIGCWWRKTDLSLIERAGHGAATAGLWLLMLGIAYLFIYPVIEKLWENPPLFIASIAVVGLSAGATLAILGGLAPAPKRITNALFHFMAALLAGFVVGIMLAAASAPVPTAAFSATGFGALVAVSSFVRYKMS